MLNFKKIIIENFLSVGKLAVEHTYTRGINLIIGKNYNSLNKNGEPESNGAGKSLIVAEALLFCLFDKTFRKIKKESYINKINKKGTKVTVFIENNGVEYEIVRGIKPTFFKYKKVSDKEYISLSSDKLTQKKFEEELGITYDSFVNRVIYNITKYESFFSRSAAEKRKTLENIINISEYGVIFEEKKKEFNEAKRSLDKIKAVVEEQKRHNKEIKKINDQIALDAKEWDAAKQEKLQKLQAEIDSVFKNLPSLDNVNIKINAIDEKIDAQKTLLTQLLGVKEKFIESMTTLKTNIDRLNSIDSSQIQDEIEKLTMENMKLIATKTKEEFDAELKDIRDGIAKIDADKTELQEKIAETRLKINTLNTQLRDANNKICPTCGQEIKTEINVDEIKEKINSANIRLERLQELFKRFEKERQELVNKENDIREEFSNFEKIELQKQHNVKKIESLNNQLNELADLVVYKEKLVKLETKFESLLNDIKQNEIVFSELRNEKEQYILERADVIKQQQQFDSLKREYAAIEDQVNPHVPKPYMEVYTDKLEKAEVEYEVKKLIRDLFSEKGIRQALIDSFLNFINTKINEYLHRLGMSNTYITFDSEFKETFKVGAHTYQYENFSAGQQKRIDLAFLLMTYDLTEQTNMLDTNLVVFDEIMDTSVDEGGMERFLTILKEKMTQKCVYIITHRKEILNSELVDNIWLVEYELFSKISKIK